MAYVPVTFNASDFNGTPLASAKLYLYEAGTTTPQAGYRDSTGGTAHANPVVALASGVEVVWLDDSLTYKLVLTNAAGSSTVFSQDNIDPSNYPLGLIIYPAAQGDQSTRTTDSVIFANGTITTDFSAGQDGAFGRDLTVGRNVNITGDLEVGGDLTLNGASLQDGDLNLTGSFTAAGTSTFTGTVLVPTYDSGDPGQAVNKTYLDTRLSPFELVLSDAQGYASSASASATAADTAKTLAENYANKAEDLIVEAGPDRYSAFHWSKKSEGFASTAATTIAQAQPVLDDLALGPSGSYILRAPQAALDAASSATASATSATESASSATASATSATASAASAAAAAVDADNADDSAAVALAAEAAIAADLAANYTRSVDTMAAWLATTTLPAGTGRLMIKGYWSVGDTGGDSFVVLSGDAASNGLVDDGIYVIETTDGSYTAVRENQGPLPLRKWGVRPGRGLSQLIYEANDTQLAAWVSAKRLALLDDDYGFWTAPLNLYIDGNKLKGEIAFCRRRNGYKRANSNVTSLFYAGPSVDVPAFLYNETVFDALDPSTSAPTGSSSPNPTTGDTFDIEGTAYVDVDFDGGLALCSMLGARAGYGNRFERCSWSGGRKQVAVFNAMYGAIHGVNYVNGHGCETGLRVGENVYDWSTDQLDYAHNGTFMIQGVGYDDNGDPLQNWWAVRSVLTAPDGSETDTAYEDRKYLVASASATGAFAGQENNVATYDYSAGTWSFETPASGDYVYIYDQYKGQRYTGSAWTDDDEAIIFGSGVVDRATRGSTTYYHTLEDILGFAAVVGSGGATGTDVNRFGYIEACGSGVFVAVDDATTGLIVELGYEHPGSGSLADQTVVIRSHNPTLGYGADWLTGATVAADRGNSDPARWTTLRLGTGGVGSEAYSVWSNTYKYLVENQSDKITYEDKVPYNFVRTTQTAVYVNASTGHDGYEGTSTKPLLTLAEAFRRIRLNPNIITINMVGSFGQQIVDVSGMPVSKITVDGGSTASIQASAGSSALIISGAGPQIVVQNFATLGACRFLYGANVQLGTASNRQDITSAQTGTAYALMVEAGSRCDLFSNATCNSARGIYADASDVYVHSSTFSSYAAGASLNAQNGAIIRTNSTVAASTWLNPANIFKGIGFEGTIYYRDAIYSIEIQDYLARSGPRDICRVYFTTAGGAIADANGRGYDSLTYIGTGEVDIELTDTFDLDEITVAGDGCAKNRIVTWDRGASSSVNRKVRVYRSPSTLGVAEEGPFAVTITKD